MTEPDPTEAELDEFDRTLGELYPKVRRLIKALRACRQEAKAKDDDMKACSDKLDQWARDKMYWRQQAEAKDAVVGAMHVILPMAKGYAAAHRVGQNQAMVEAAENILAALDNLPSVAKQGETDDAE